MPRNFATHALDRSPRNWREYPALHSGATDIQRAQHRIQAHKHKIKYHEKWAAQHSKQHEMLLARREALAGTPLSELHARHAAATARVNQHMALHGGAGTPTLMKLDSARAMAEQDVRAKQYGPHDPWHKSFVKKIKHHTAAANKERVHLARNEQKLAAARTRRAR